MAMVKNPFNGQLAANRVYATVFNVILKEVMMDNKISNNNSFYNRFSEDVGLLGDTVLYYSVDTLPVYDWLGHKNTPGQIDATNVLEQFYPDDPYCQAVTIDTFKQIRLTTDSMLSKQFWSTITGFNDFNNIIIGNMAKAKNQYLDRLFNCYMGTAEADATKAPGSVYEIPLSDISATGEEKNRLESQMISQYIADLITSLLDYNTKYNELGYIRAYDKSDLMFVFNSAWVNRITKLDLPTIHHMDDLFTFENQLPSHYFGVAADFTDTDHFTTAQDNSVTVKTGVTNVYFKNEIDYVNASSKTVHARPGDVCPAGTTVKSATVDLEDLLYVGDEDIIAKVMTKSTFKVLSAFDVNSEFYNARSLNTNRYSTFGFGMDRLVSEPLITIHAD